MESEQNNFVDVFNTNLTYILTSFLTFDDCMNSLLKLNKRYYEMLTGPLDPIWKRFFTNEFSRLDYPDHYPKSGESALDFFRRSFKVYQHIRHLLKNIFDLTNEVSENK